MFSLNTFSERHFQTYSLDLTVKRREVESQLPISCKLQKHVRATCQYNVGELLLSVSSHQRQLVYKYDSLCLFISQENQKMIMLYVNEYFYILMRFPFHYIVQKN